jgi:diphosphomevalonate decarboxylase
MHDIQTQFVKNVLSGAKTDLKEVGKAFAPSNIALSKYWGKRDLVLNLPINSSLSVSLGSLGTRTTVRELGDGAPQGGAVRLNGELLPPDAHFSRRVAEFIGLFPDLKELPLEVCTENNIPTAAGLASSASGFAALVMALDDFAGWGLSKKQLSMLARLGSGSASRSVYDGFVEWYAGEQDDGLDSYAEQLPFEWPEFRIGILEVSDAEKPVGSRDGMNRTVETSELYKSWPAQAARDIATIRDAIKDRDFKTLGRAAENNALSMHATMMSAWPPLIYMRPESMEQVHKVQRVRADGLEVFLTMDAGPNIKLLFSEEIERDVVSAFSGLQVIQPFGE